MRYTLEGGGALALRANFENICYWTLIMLVFPNFGLFRSISHRYRDNIFAQQNLKLFGIAIRPKLLNLDFFKTFKNLNLKPYA